MDKKSSIDPTTEQKVEVALIDAIYRQANIGFLASVICGTLVLISLMGIRSPLVLYTWYGVFVGIIILRIISVQIYLRTTVDPQHLYRWYIICVAGAFLSGLSWGIAGSPILLPSESSLTQALILLILAGIAAGGAAILAPVRNAALSFVIAVLTPLLINFIFIESRVYILFDIAICIFLLYLIVLCFKIHGIIRNSVRLQFENDALLKKLHQAATHDPLTHVANRSLFEARFKEAIAKAKKENKILVLFYMDLDNFKEVNDVHGHNAGDQLLLIVIGRVKNILRDKDFVSRLGGDELTIILGEVKDLPTVADIAHRICQTISQPIKVDNAEVQVHASIGISIYPTDGKDMETLLRAADHAMYYIKQHGGNNFHFSTPPRIKAPFDHFSS